MLSLMKGEAGLPFGMFGEGEARMPFATAAEFPLGSAMLDEERDSDGDRWEWEGSSCSEGWGLGMFKSVSALGPAALLEPTSIALA